MTMTHAYAAPDATQPLAPWTLQRRAPQAHDVDIEILYCGVCHSDVHTARSEWGGTVYPCVPGHEIIGRVTAVGGAVTRFKAGQTVGVGCLVDACRQCGACDDGLEQYCERGFTGTYNGKDKHLGGVTFGGYSTRIVVDENFVLRVPDNLDPAAAAPLLCAGITLYSPLRHWKVVPGMSVGIVGLGGLGHMGVKLAHAMGAKVTLFTTTPAKGADAQRLGADEVVVSTDAAQMKAQAKRFDLIINTVAVAHDLNPYLAALKRDGTLVLIGVPEKPHPTPAASNLIFQRRSIGGSLIGGIAETQEMLNFCGEHGIVSDIELIKMQDINHAYDRMVRSDVRYRFVIDLASLKQA